MRDSFQRTMMSEEMGRAFYCGGRSEDYESQAEHGTPSEGIITNLRTTRFFAFKKYLLLYMSLWLLVFLVSLCLCPFACLSLSKSLPFSACLSLSASLFLWHSVSLFPGPCLSVCLSPLLFLSWYVRL